MNIMATDDENKAEAKADDDSQAAEDSGAESITLSIEGADEGATDESDLVEGDLKLDGSVVGEETASNDRDRLVPVHTDPVTPGGPGDQAAPSKDEKAFVLAGVTQPEVTSENPEPYSMDELNHRFSHVPPEGYQEHKITIQQ
jgi:hypothetical protein